jgi:hypothetical protein
MEVLHTQALGPKARRAVEQAHSLGTTWTYLEDHLREQRERIDNLLSDTLRTGELISPEGPLPLLQEGVPIPGHGRR